MKEASHEIWERIKKEKDKKNISDKDFEIELGLNPKTINNWKRGKSSGYMKMLPEIADYFNVSVDYLLGREEKMPAGFPTDISDLEADLRKVNFPVDEWMQLTDEQKNILLSTIENFIKSNK